jgi:NAD(P)-dependent dehydrogenase (short-subunit alcohol dehydrogenase family)
MDLELSNRIAVVTGASVGIGRGIAKELAAEGAQTVVVARRASLLASLAEEIAAAVGLWGEYKKGMQRPSSGESRTPQSAIGEIHPQV